VAKESIMDGIALGSGVRIGLVQRKGEFLGLGAVRAGRTTLRRADRPMFVAVRGPDAVELCDYRLADRREEGDATVLTFTMQRRDGDLMDWMVHSVRNRRRLADWTARPRPAEGTRLELTLRPLERTIGPRKYVGFSYQYHYSSPDIPIYRLLDRGTWEPGGSAVGCEFWLRNCFVPPLVRFTSPAEYYCTEWYLPGIVNPNIFQFMPLQTESQGFSFTAGDAGLLVTAPAEVRHIRSMFEKPRDSELIVHWHEHCDDLAGELTTAPVEVLFSPGRSDRVQRANAYEAVRADLSQRLHRQIGMREERVSTYGMIEEWGNADMARYSDLGVPALLKAEVKTIGLANHFQTNMNVFGVSNMCCTVDLKFADSYGGEPAMRRLCGAIRAGGAVPQMWGNTSISTLTWQFAMRHGREDRVRFLPHEGSIMEALAKSDDAFVRNPSGAVEADHYAPVFAVMNLRDPAVREYWLRRWGEANQTGLGGIFLDSSFNLSSDKFHFKYQADPKRPEGATADQVELLGNVRPAAEPPSAVLSQYRAHLDLMVAMQHLGYEYCSEDLGVFGIHRHGPDVKTRLGNLFLWPECLAGFDVESIRRAGGDPDDVYFRGLAYRMVWMIFWDIQRDQLSFFYGGVRNESDRPSAWHLSLLRAFNATTSRMLRRRILPEERGVLYEDANGPAVLWAFEDLTLTLDAPVGVRDVITGGEGGGEPSAPTARLKAQAHHVYLLTPA
jgi:hypothetical protein